MSLNETARACGIVLAGGQGTRIRHLYPGLPKPMIPAAGRPFVEWVLRWLAEQGLQECVVSLGHLSEVAERYFTARPGNELHIRRVREPAPLGTGGAIAWAAQAAPDAELFVVTNGDSLVLADLSPAWELLRDRHIDGVVVGLEVDDAARYGRLDVGANGRLSRFSEKQPGAGLINGGVYVLRRRLIDRFPAARPLSIETQVFPTLLVQGAQLAVFACRAPFLDIGTPESVAHAEAFIQTHFSRQVAA
ncbi:MAG TPA: sugar phosphate nucleotidyltransferase [Pirellulales bacterium]|nr:sugar phosphate nucleotidyltransferase [Pirellulales bacterium]